MEPTATDLPRLNINVAELIKHVEELLEEAATDTPDTGRAVNWADLGVADVEYRLSLLEPSAGPWCVVTVGEASPDCALAAWLNDRLDQERFPLTCIECEW